jgi:RNA polymerase sigma factor (sigma-70 family)
VETVARHLREHTFAELFLALGWERATGTLERTVGGYTLTFTRVAQLWDVSVFTCPADPIVLRDRRLRRAFQRLVGRSGREHLILFTGEDPRRQVWQWGARVPWSQRLRHGDYAFPSDHPPGPFLARLAHLRFDPGGAPATSAEVRARLRRALDSTPEAPPAGHAERSAELFRALQQGEAGARERFVLMHLGLVWRFSRPVCGLGLAPEEAAQIGTLGLLTAVEHHRPESGYQFSTVAREWIRSACWRYGLRTALLIRVPEHAFWPGWRLTKELDRLACAGSEAVRARLAELEAEDPRRVAFFRDYQRARTVDRFSDPEVDRRVRQLVDPVAPPDARLLRADEVARVRAAVGQLPARSAQILRLRYGLNGKPKTLQQVGERLGLTRERVRQIEDRAKEWLRELLGGEPEPPAEPRASSAPLAPSVGVRSRTDPAVRAPSAPPAPARKKRPARKRGKRKRRLTRSARKPGSLP